ncbi:MAG: VWA domain-containing protein, partial [Pseudoxanthomonas sp.]
MNVLHALPAWLHALHLLRPQWLWALLALPLPWLVWLRARRAANVWREAVDAHLLAHLLAGAGRRGWAGLAAALLAWTLGVLALAGPSWRQDEQPLWQTRTPLVIALDLSARTDAADLQPSRLLQARAKLAALLRERAGGQVGLVAFAGQPFTVAPLTDDAANVALFLDALEPEVMPVPGHEVGQALAWSQQLLQQAGFDRGQILLLTDADAGDGAAAAAKARQAGFQVSVLGVGTEAGAAYRDARGGFERARLDPASLQRLAGAGGGRYQPLTADDADLRALGVLDPQAADASVAQGQKGLAWRDQGYWLLPALLLLALLGFRRGGALAALLLGVGLAAASAPLRA